MKKLVTLVAISAFLTGCGTQTTPAETATNVTSKPLPTYTIADLAAHTDHASCWTAIDGVVYDLTAWIDKHPGGDKNILKICGIDGTAAFQQQHGGNQRVENVLAGFEIGTLTQ